MPMLILWAILLAAIGGPLAVMLGDKGLAYLASARAWLGPALVSLTGVAVSLAYLRRRITLDDAGLTIRSTFYTRTVAIGSLRLESARIVDLAEHGELKPALKTNGYGLPGFRSGHYRMRDGGKAFCLITDHSRVLSLPLRDGSRVLISPEQPRALLAALEQRAGKPAP
ncbi:PH domain-containing protein [Stenotrophomonas mori]|uniref:PH domain-containing protein n=1 Tax=Stenotrophomonas mori TaxID=2871096 RepID=A0ABT0SGA8_9GAMM|nr:PH domain-containing protein [Stenotrophomonas mori]MCL7714359.1 PH domain-containing protein [Stenotrophomonas mori]